MKVVDNTPFPQEKGSSGAWKRTQEAPESGPTWHAELEAQLAGVLDEGYTLIRNLPLGNTKIVEPLVLIGPPGVFILYVSPVAPLLDVREGESNANQDSLSTPPSVNLVARVARLAQALELHLDRLGVSLPNAVEPVLVAASPAVHIEVRRRRVRVVLSDGLQDFAAWLLQQPALLTTDEALRIVDHLLNPDSQGVADRTQPVRARAAAVPANLQTAALGVPQASARARAIFRAAEDAKPFDLADLNLRLDGQDLSAVPYELSQRNPSQRLASVKRRRGFSSRQWTVLVIMLLVELLVLSAFTFLVLFGT